MSTQPVMAAQTWTSNAHIIADVARLHLHPEMPAVDVTYGRGTWWKLWRPEHLVEHDICLDGVDFRKLPHDDDSFELAAFDPPYVCTGGRETTTMPEFANRYGLKDAPRTPALLQEMNDDGLAEVTRVVRPGGLILSKSADYVWSGKLVLGTYATMCAALALGLEVVDRFVHVGRARAQPPRKRKDGQVVRQHHARGNLSTLLVLKVRKTVRS